MIYWKKNCIGKNIFIFSCSDSFANDYCELLKCTDTSSNEPNVTGSMLPWGSAKGPAAPPPDSELRPGEFTMRLLFTEFTLQAERKMEAVMAEPLVSN